MDKGQPGYITYKKKKQLLSAILLFLAALAIFFAGLFLNKMQKNNIFSILAVLMMLPAAKMLVGYIVVMPYKSIEKAKYHELSSLSRLDMTLLSDLVITSSEKVMNLDFIAILNGNVVGQIGKQTQDISYIETYLMRSLKNQGFTSYNVKIFREYKQFLNRLNSIKKEEEIQERDLEVKSFILTLNV